jgi:hypothetical protein
VIAPTEWAVSLPNPATARQGADALTRALEDAHATIREVADRFHGTVPPPPWPADPALVAAIDKAQKMAEGLDALARQTSDLKWHAGSKPYDAARAAGVEVLAKAAALKARADALPEAADPATLIPKIVKQAAKPLFQIGGPVLLWVAVGWLVLEASKGSRRRGGIFG